nr:arginase family protein [Actinoplanes solisilvae]
MRRIAVLDAPSNLGLRPPTETSVPGCAKAPGALRDKGLLTKLDARDAGCLTPPRYDAGDWRPGDGVAHAPQIAAYSRALADRIGAILDAGEFPVVLGGDCSIVLGSGLAMHRLGEAVGGRIGLVFVDGHSDFRHPGNASYVGAAAGEDLALVTGRGQADLAAIEGRRPYFRDIDVVVMGIRAQDEYRLDLQAAGIVTRPVPALRAEGAARSAQWARDQLVDCAGYWVHVDVDVLDPAVMPAVDAPSPGGIAFPELEILLAGLVESPHCLGVEITVFDPDYDADGSYAVEIVNAVTAGLAAAHTVTPRPDLIAARADLNRPEAARTAAVPAAAGLSAADSEDAGLKRAGADDDDRLGLAAGLGRPSRPGGLRRTASADAEDRWGLTGGLNRPERPVGLNRASASFEEEREREKRRAAAADESVSLAAAGMSSGVPAAPEEAAVPATTLLGVEDGDELPAEDETTEKNAVEYAEGDADDAGEEPTDHWTDEPAAGADDDEDDDEDEDEDEPGPMPPRPLGQAPLLDSEPLPATRPGMLRPRTAEDRDGFSLPAQRPAFELGSGTPADIA